MAETTEYYVVKRKALPDVLLQVVEAKRLLETARVSSVQEAVGIVGISRSSFYKYKDDISEFHDNSIGTTITIGCTINDEPGALSDLLRVIARGGANILTIHQSIPISGKATLSLSVQLLAGSIDGNRLIENMSALEGVHSVNLIAKE